MEDSTEEYENRDNESEIEQVEIKYLSARSKNNAIVVEKGR